MAKRVEPIESKPHNSHFLARWVDIFNSQNEFDPHNPRVEAVGWDGFDPWVLFFFTFLWPQNKLLFGCFIAHIVNPLILCHCSIPKKKKNNYVNVSE